MTSEEFKARVIEMATAGMPGADAAALVDQGIEVDTLNANVLSEFCQMISRDRDRYYYLQKSTTVLVTDGVGTLPDEFFGESATWGDVVDDEGNVCSQVRSLSDLRRPLSSEFAYFCLAGSHIYFKGKDEYSFNPVLPTDPPGPGFTRSLNLVVNYSPTLDTLDLVHPTLLDELVQLAINRLRQAMGVQQQ